MLRPCWPFAFPSPLHLIWVLVSSVWRPDHLTQHFNTLILFQYPYNSWSAGGWGLVIIFCLKTSLGTTKHKSVLPTIPASRACTANTSYRVLVCKMFHLGQVSSIIEFHIAGLWACGRFIVHVTLWWTGELSGCTTPLPNSTWVSLSVPVIMNRNRRF